VKDLRGFGSILEMQLLYQTACGVPVGEGIVEIGTLAGRSCAVLASSGRPVWTLDIAGPPAELTAVLAECPNVRARRLDSICCPEPPWPVGLLYIDGDHTGTHPLSDLRRFLPWLAENARVIWHDWMPAPCEPGVTRSVADAEALGWIRRGLHAGRLLVSTLSWNWKGI